MKQAEFLTSEEVAALLRKSHPSVCRLLRAGKLPDIQVGRGWLGPRQSLEAMLQGTPEPMAPRRRMRPKLVPSARPVPTARAKTNRAPRADREVTAAADEQLRLALEEMLEEKSVAQEMVRQHLVSAQKAVRTTGSGAAAIDASERVRISLRRVLARALAQAEMAVIASTIPSTSLVRPRETNVGILNRETPASGRSRCYDAW
jgi:excisionase family DNA binding protein